MINVNPKIIGSLHLPIPIKEEEKEVIIITVLPIFNITSEPERAKIYIDGIYQNDLTPLNKPRELTAGKHTFALEKTNYQRWEETVDLKLGDVWQKIIILAPIQIEDPSTPQATSAGARKRDTVLLIDRESNAPDVIKTLLLDMKYKSEISILCLSGVDATITIYQSISRKTWIKREEIDISAGIAFAAPYHIAGLYCQIQYVAKREPTTYLHLLIQTNEA